MLRILVVSIAKHRNRPIEEFTQFEGAPVACPHGYYVNAVLARCPPSYIFICFYEYKFIRWPFNDDEMLR